MLSKKTMDSIAVMTGITADVLAQAISDEQEKDLELPEGEFLTKEKKETLLDNHGKRKYDEGVSKATKDAFDGQSKDDFLKSKIAEALEDAKVEPNKKITELTNSLETLRTKLSEKDEAYSNLESSIKGERTKLEAQTYIPELPESIGLKKSEAADLLLRGIEFKEDGIYKDGSILKDGMEKAISLEQYMRDSVKERGWAETPKGRGGGSGAGSGGSSSKPKTLEEYEKVIKEKRLRPGSEEANSLLNEAAKDNPEFYGV